jgi:glycosyltransferase involved in cell wall biosynthesis
VSVATWLKKRSKGKLYLILRDIFPQNGVDLNLISKKGLPYHYFRKLEMKLYKESDKIGCMSPENINYIKRHNDYLDFSKLHLLKNWEELAPLENDEKVKKENYALRKKYDLLDKTIALYGGNMGRPQQMENIIHLAETVQDKEDLVFLILGWGTEKERIVEMAKSKKLENVIFLDSVSRIEFSAILRLADIGLITLNQNFTIPNYPSKVNAYYKFKIPVLAAVDINTDFGKIQEEIGCGYWSLSGDTEAFKANLLKLYKNRTLRKEMGKKGYDYMVNNLTPQRAYEQVIKQF